VATFHVKPLDENTWREISRLGGGTVESYPEDAAGRSVSVSFLHNGTVSMFIRKGFKRSRRVGKNHWVVTKVVSKSSQKRPPLRRLRD